MNVMPSSLSLSLVMCATACQANVWQVSPDPLPGVAESVHCATISDAAERARPGDTVLIHTGVYRETVDIQHGGLPGRPIRFCAADGARVVVSGADHITDWTPVPESPGVFRTHWPYRFITWGRDNTHAGALPVGRAEQVHVEGYPLLQVQDATRLAPGTFAVDMEEQALYICPVANSVAYEPVQIQHVRVEASTRSAIWVLNAPYVEVRGVIFRYAANHAQEGAVQVKAAHARFDDCQFERVNGVALRVEGQDARVYRCVFRDNGYGAFEAAGAHGMRLVDCVITNNNVKGYDRGWGAVNKIVLSRDVLVDRCQFLRNRGFGLWFDIGNQRCVVSRSLFADNEQAGLFYEISYSLDAHDNVFIRNGWEAGYGSWGAAAGLVLSSSERCRVERNLFYANYEGLAFREQRRTTPTITSRRERPIWNRDHRIERNLFSANGVHVWGWFAQQDARHWPKGSATSEHPGTGSDDSGDMACRYIARDAEGQPVGLVLSDLKLTINGNMYATSQRSVLWGWGAQWSAHRTYRKLAELRLHLGFEVNGHMINTPFRDPRNNDFRLPAGHIVLRQGCYPAASVPGVCLSECPVR